MADIKQDTLMKLSIAVVVARIVFYISIVATVIMYFMGYPWHWGVAVGVVSGLVLVGGKQALTPY